MCRCLPATSATTLRRLPRTPTTAGSAPATASGLDEEGTITFVERDKDVLKVGGENVGAPEIERVLLSVPGVVEAAVVGRPDPMLGDVPVAFVVVEDGTVVVAAIEAACEASLPPFKRPREIRVVAELPRATLGKVAKAQLRDWARDAPRPPPS